MPEEDTADEETLRVREAAGQALAEANERLMEANMKLKAAEEARQELQQQLAAAGDLATQVGEGRVP